MVVCSIKEMTTGHESVRCEIECVLFVLDKTKRLSNLSLARKPSPAKPFASFCHVQFPALSKVTAETEMATHARDRSHEISFPCQKLLHDGP